MKYKVKSILFLGIGGISMYQLAIAIKNMGVKVYGYDLNKSKYTQICEDNGIKVFHKFNKEICNVDICVSTGAIKSGKFFDYLKRQNIPILDRSEILAWICSKFKTVIAVAGTHGKSTTSALIYQILKNAGKKVSCHIGAEVADARLNFEDEFLVVEACEYNKSFLKLKPTISIVTNIEKEHMDSYGTLFNLKSAFLSFLRSGDKRYVFVDKSTKFLEKYNNIKWVKDIDISIEPKIKGEYNLKNIALAVAVCRDLCVKDDMIKKTINNFLGIPRRYECLGEWNGGQIYLDYAHHPTEVKAFVETFQKENKKTQIVFQPHTYSRTKNFFKEFVEVFSKIDNLIIYKEYPARENKDKGVSAKELYLEVKKINPNVEYCNSIKLVSRKLKSNYAIAFVGAGDINLVAEQIKSHF